MTAIRESETWLDNCRQRFGQNYQPYLPVPVRFYEITEQRQNLERKVKAFTNIPKPKVEAPKEEELAPPEVSNMNEDAEPQSMDLD